MNCSRHSFPSTLRMICASLALGMMTWMGGGNLCAQTTGAPPGGYQINNTADLHYDKTDGTTVIRPSNMVSAAVPYINAESFTLTTDRSYIVSVGSTLTLPHTLFNGAGMTTVFQMDLQNLGSDQFDLESLQLVLDANANGVADPGETRIAQGGTLTVAGGQSLELLIVGTVPTNLPESALGRVGLTATSTTSSNSATNVDTLTVQTPRITLIKTADKQEAKRGDEVSFSLRASNSGGYATPLAVRVDNSPRDYVVIRDIIPANTTFASFPGAGGGVRLYHRRGDARHVYSSAPSADLSIVDAVGIGLSSLGAGDSASGTFTVTVNKNASAPFTNTAEIVHRNGTTEDVLWSNIVTVSVPTVPPTITYYGDDTFTKTTNTGHLGNPLHIEADAAACNMSPIEVEQITITIDSKLTGDQESFIAIETGPNTGVFRVVSAPTADASRTAVVKKDGTIQSLTDDTLTATIEGCGGKITSVKLVIDPSGVAIDSQTCEPLPGVTIALIDVTGAGNGGNPGGLATVYEADSVTLAPNPVVTGADGKYQFPLVHPSTYRLDVQGPPGSFFPSQLPTPVCSTDNSDNLGSGGENFPVSTDTGAVFIDVPVDVPVATGGFTLEKIASRDTAEVGDSIIYNLKLSNNTLLPFDGVQIDDVLPRGFTYEPGSTRVDGVLIADPSGGRGPLLSFAVGEILAGKKLEMSYRVRIESDTRPGETFNTAQAHTLRGVGATTNRAVASVTVESGVFTDKGVVLGKVFFDSNGNRIQDAAEPGVPGVRLYLENGTYAVTDSEGKYSFYGVRPVTHTLKLDRTTLPAGAELEVLDSRNAGDGGSRFVDLKNGEMHKANFALVGSDLAVMDKVMTRREKSEVEVAEIDQAMRDRLEPDARVQPLGDTRSLPASGTVGGGGSAAAVDSATAGGGSLFTSVLPTGTLTSGNSSLPTSPVVSLPRMPLESYIEGMTVNTPGFIGLADHDNVAGRQITVRVKGPMGSQFTLLVNGAEIPYSRVGKKVSNVSAQIEAWEFLGLDLKPGDNQLELVARDSFGNERSRQAITVRAPDSLSHVKVEFSNAEPFADGVTPVTMTVRLVDDAGTPVSARTPLTLESQLARWQVKDLDPKEPGTQVFIEGGEAKYELLPPDSPADDKIVVSSGAIKTEVTLPYLPELRPLIASGVLEGRIQLRGFNLSGLSSASPSDAFEEELQEFSRSDDLRTSGRAAFFLKGKIKGDLLLTMAYDTDKDTSERLFRDIEPDRYYPIYGDSSLRGYDAQSTSHLYLRIDKKKSYLLVGDFSTQSLGEQRSLGNYQRSLNGVRGHYETNRVVANVWGSKDTTRQVIREIAANGTSGPYEFSAAFGRINSEQVEILTRDRNQPSIILETKAMQRYTDYEFEPFSGRILFRDPVSSADANLNPRSIRITYEVDQGGDPFWVYGADAQVRLNKRVEVGGSAIQDENPEDQQRILSANATVMLGANTFLLGEVAQSRTDLKGTGMGGRIDIRHTDAKTEARVYYGQTDAGFVNPGASLTAGRVEGGAKVTRALDDSNRIIAQGLITKDGTSSGGHREGVRVDWEHSFQNKMKIEVGSRWSEETLQPAGPNTQPGALSDPSANAAAVTPFEVRSARVKFTMPVPNITDATMFGEYEQDVVRPDQRLVAVGGEWQFANRGRLYGRHEVISALGGPFELNQVQQNNVTLIGFETDYMKGGRVFNEYRTRDAFSGRESEASTGLRNEFQIADGLRLSAGVERVTPFDGTTQNESTAVTSAIEYTANPLWKATARVEARWADTSDSLLNTLGYARKINRDWTFLAKSIYYGVDSKDATAQDVTQARILTGFAWRPTNSDVWNLLAKYEYRYEDGSMVETPKDILRHVQLVSVSVNWQPVADWIFSARYAAKMVDESYVGDDATYFGHLLSTRALWELSKRWDAGLSVSLGSSRGMDRYSWAVGPEAGYNFRSNMRVGLGYNLTGFYDRDLVGEIPTDQGFFLNMRLKFDEDMFGLGKLFQPRLVARKEGD